jgi:hypothetical protein
MASYMGSNFRKFFHIYEDQVEIIQRKMVEYIKTLQPLASEEPNSSRMDLLISTKNGFPWVPPLVDGIEQKKEELEKMLRVYMNAQYSPRFRFIYSSAFN